MSLRLDEPGPSTTSIKVYDKAGQLAATISTADTIQATMSQVLPDSMGDEKQTENTLATEFCCFSFAYA